MAASAPRPDRLLILGGWGHHYLEAVAAEPEVTVGVCGDGHDDVAKLRAGTLDGAEWFDDPLEALDGFAPDVVSIGGVYGSNGHWLEQALGRGIPTVCDKPIATSEEQLRRIGALARRSDVPVLTELPLRCDAAVRSATQAVADGRIGEPVLATAQKSYKWGAFRPPWYADPERYTGTVLWIGTHALDLVVLVSGRAATPLGGHGGNVAHSAMAPMEDHTATLLALDGGGTAVVHTDYLRPEGAPTHGDDRIRLAGTAGVVEVRDGRCELITRDDGPTDITDPDLGVPVHEALLAALDGDRSTFSTEHSLATAHLALAARDASSPTVGAGGDG